MDTTTRTGGGLLASVLPGMAAAVSAPRSRSEFPLSAVSQEAVSLELIVAT
jgi:hypothetical protein